MANSKHVDVVLKGRKTLALWRKKYPKVRLDLTEAELSHCDLRGANFRGANLVGADFRESELAGSVFTDADLTRSNCSGSDFRRSQFDGANLFRAVLDHCDLSGVSARQANLGGCQLRDANLTDADLTGADLSQADLSGAVLTRTSLTRSNVGKANFAGARFNRVLLADIDLTFAEGLASVHHDAPSSLGVDTLSRSAHLLTEFVQGCGVPEPLIRALGDDELQASFAARFLCYAEEDAEVIGRIYDGLQRRGIRCWKNSRGPVPDDAGHNRFVAQLRPGDQVVLCLSQGSLSSLWIDATVESIVAREQQFRQQTGRDRAMLLPLNLDGYFLGGNWRHRHQNLVRSRLAAEFSGWRRNNTKFERELTDLAGALADAARGGRR